MRPLDLLYYITLILFLVIAVGLTLFYIVYGIYDTIRMIIKRKIKREREKEEYLVYCPT